MTEAKVEYVFKGKKRFAFQIFFYCQFESAIQVSCYLDKIKRIFQAVDSTGGTISLLT